MNNVRPEILDRVRACVAESLALDLADITAQSRLMDDLGANSLDFIDIVFLLERDLSIKVQKTELNFLTRLDFSSPEVMKEGHLQVSVIKRLSPWLPALAALPDPSQVSPRQLFSLITVESIALVVQLYLDQPEPLAQ